jgi:hypothetical protein
MRARRPESALRRAQRWAADKIENEGEPGLILAWDCGAGKTGAVLTGLRRRLDSFASRKVLVVAPKLVAETVWPDEIEEWAHTCAISYSVVVGTETQRLAALAAPAEIYIINKDNMLWLWEHLGCGARFDFDTLVIDENLAKNGTKHTAGKLVTVEKNRIEFVDGKRVKVPVRVKKKVRGDLSRFGVAAHMRRHVKTVIELTGSPSPNGVKNLWGLAYLVDLGVRLGLDKRAFELRWFSVETNNGIRKIRPHPHSEREITERVRDIMFSLGPDDYAETPGMLSPQIKVTLPANILKAYREFARTFVAEAYDVEAVNRGVLHNKLMQFANGSMYQEDGADVWVHDEKLDALVQLVEDINGAPLLVAYSFEFDVRRIRRAFPRAVVLNEEASARDVCRRWNDGQIDLLLAHRASAGHGLNMQYGSNHMAQYGLTADLELYEQFNKRLDRSGQTKTVYNHHILAEGTIDMKVIPDFLSPKAATQGRVLDAVRVDLSKYQK